MKTFLAALASVALALPASAALIPFDLSGRSGVGMRPDNENPTASGSGLGVEFGSGIAFDDVSKILTINVVWNGLTGVVTAAHIHQSADFTTNGGVIFSLDGATPGYSNSANGGGWTGTTVTLNTTQETQLLASQLYLNAHTATNPGGEIRANLVPVPEPASVVLAAMGMIGLAARGRIRRRQVVAA